MMYVDETEAKIAKRLVGRILKDGCEIAIHDGCGMACHASSNRAKILDAMGTTGSDKLIVYKDRKPLGWIVLIWGNDEDIVSDFSDNPTIAGYVGA